MSGRCRSRATLVFADADGKLMVRAAYCKAKTCDRCWPGYRANLTRRVEQVFGPRPFFAKFLYISIGKKRTSDQKTLYRAGASYVGFQRGDGAIEYLVAVPGGVSGAVPEGWQPLPDWRGQLERSIAVWDRGRRLISSQDINAAQRPLTGWTLVAYTHREIEWVIGLAEQKQVGVEWAAPDCCFMRADDKTRGDFLNAMSSAN